MTFSQFLFYLLRLIFVPHSPHTLEWKMLRFLNKDRQENGLNTVKMQKDLREVARKHSFDMAEKEYFDHINPKKQSPSDRLNLARITEACSGENLAKIKGYPNPTLEAEIGLMNSPGHRANILNSDFNCVGIGVIKSKEEIYYFTQNFARRELFFKHRLPKKIRLKKGLKISGYVLSTKIKKLIYQITQNQKIINKGVIEVQNRSFKQSLFFPVPGLYQIVIFTPDGKTHLEFKGINKFDLKVKRGLFF